MTTEDKRKEILDLLARGKIDIDEAVDLLDTQPVETISKGDAGGGADPQPIRVDIEETAGEGKGIPVEQLPAKVSPKANGSPRWLRIQVGELDTGKNKVQVNVPFGMVRFGLGLARIFSPGDYSENLAQISDAIANADTGLLVDVQDAESNEHVRIFYE